MVSTKLSVVDDVFADYYYVCLLTVYLYTISDACSFYTAYKSLKSFSGICYKDGIIRVSYLLFLHLLQLDLLCCRMPL